MGWGRGGGGVGGDMTKYLNDYVSIPCLSGPIYIWPANNFQKASYFSSLY